MSITFSFLQIRSITVIEPVCKVLQFPWPNTALKSCQILVTSWKRNLGSIEDEKRYMMLL
jgi:hypothetical protein